MAHISDGTQRAGHAAHRMVGLGLRPEYHVRYENVAQFVDDPFAWFIWVVELPEVWATASTEAAVGATARDVIATTLQVPTDAFDVMTQPESHAPAPSTSGDGELVLKGRDGRGRMQNTIGRPDPRRSKG